MRPFINASGVLFYNGIKEPPLAAEAIKAANAAACSYGEGEDLSSTGLPCRNRISELFSVLAGIEEVLVVNNISAAIFLVFHALARGKEIILPREELYNNNINNTSSSLNNLAEQSGARLRIVNNKKDMSEVSSPVNNNSACFLTLGTCNSADVADESSLVQFGQEHNLVTVKIM